LTEKEKRAFHAGIKRDARKLDHKTLTELRVWNELQNNDLGCQVIATPKPLRQAVISFLRFLQKMSRRVRTYFHSAAAQYAATV